MSDQPPHDPLDAFVPGPRCTIAGAASGPLAGVTLAVKDLIDAATDKAAIEAVDITAGYPA